MLSPSADPPRAYCPRLLTRDFARTWAFYRDVIGLTPRKGNGEPPYGEFVEGDRAVLAVFDRGAMAAAVGLEPVAEPLNAVGSALVGFEVTDVDATANRLRSAGVALLRPPTDRHDWMLRTLHVRDPDGFLVELFQPIPPDHSHPHPHE